MSPAGSSILSVLPPEIAEHALSYCSLKDIIAFSVTSKTAYRIVHNPPPPQLWRAVFLTKFDLSSARAKSHNWKDYLYHTLRAGQLVRGQSVSGMTKKEALEVLISLIDDMPALADPLTDGISLNGAWIIRTLQGSKFISTQENWSDEPQLEAKLRACVSIAVEHASQARKSQKSRTPSSQLMDRRTRCRAYAYDLRHYNEKNHYGPFLSGEERRVNWVHVEALMNVVYANICDIPHKWATEILPPANNLEFLRADSAPRSADADPTDWAGVEGSWARYVCFMDYRELFAFNFTAMYDGPHNPAYFEDPAFREATRLIQLKLHLTSPDKLKFRGLTEDTSEHQRAGTIDGKRKRRWGPRPSDGDKIDDDDDGGDDDSHDASVSNDPRYPTLYFSGSSHGAVGNEATIEGNVRMGVDGVPLWRFVSIYDGHTQWSSEGVQLGQVNSAMGVIGVWTSDSHDDGDPAGPFWFWKPTQSLEDLDEFP